MRKKDHNFIGNLSFSPFSFSLFVPVAETETERPFFQADALTSSRVMCQEGGKKGRNCPKSVEGSDAEVSGFSPIKGTKEGRESHFELTALTL